MLARSTARHDLLDVFTPSDRVLVLESGRISEIGPVAEVLTAPRSLFAARIAGVNVVSGMIGPDGALHTGSGAHWYGSPAPQAGAELADGQGAVAVFPPTAVSVFREPPHGSPRNCVEVTVAELDVRGATVASKPTARRDWPRRSPSTPLPTCG